VPKILLGEEDRENTMSFHFRNNNKKKKKAKKNCLHVAGGRDLVGHFDQTVELNLLQELPIRLGLDGRVPNLSSLSEGGFSISILRIRKSRGRRKKGKSD